MTARDSTIERKDHTTWRSVFLHGSFVSMLVLGLYTYWFIIAERHIVFLYNHDMGPFYPDTSPLSAVTASRYRMTGLVAGGIVLLLYVAANWLLGRLKHGYMPPAWPRVWAVTALPLLIGIPVITMTAPAPSLPLVHAILTTLIALLGVGLALLPGEMAARRPRDLLLLALDGGGMAGVLLSLSLVERATWLWQRGSAWGLGSVGGGLIVSFAWLLAMTELIDWGPRQLPSAAALYAAGLCVAYLLLPALHYLAFTDGYYYITDQDNFFSRSWAWQIVAWLATAAIAASLARLRVHLARRSPGSHPKVAEGKENRT